METIKGLIGLAFIIAIFALAIYIYKWIFVTAYKGIKFLGQFMQAAMDHWKWEQTHK